MNVKQALISFVLVVMLAPSAQAQRVTSGGVQDTLPWLESSIRATPDQTGVPGLAVAVVYQDEVVNSKSFSVHDR